MQQDHIELKQRRDIGEIITIYFDFFKRNLKDFLNIFIRYNGVFLLGFLGVSYLLVTGFIGTMRSASSVIGGTGSVETFDSQMYIGIGVIGFLILMIITTALNYSLAASYSIEYQENKGIQIEKKQVWKRVSNNLGSIILFVIVAIVMYVVVMVIGVIISFIPILGTFAYYAIQLGFLSWMGLSFMAMLYEKRDLMSAIGEGWNLLFKYFWKSVLVNLVVSLLLFFLLMLVLTIPSVLIGIYAYFSLEAGVDLQESAVAKVVWTLAFSIFLILYTFNQSLSQFVNSILYFSVHEQTYNQVTRSRIEQIGASE